VTKNYFFTKKKKLFLICKENIKIMDVLNKNIEDVILLEYFNILSVQLSEENEKELKIIYKDGEI